MKDENMTLAVIFIFILLVLFMFSVSVKAKVNESGEHVINIPLVYKNNQYDQNVGLCARCQTREKRLRYSRVRN